jgi:pantoate--beta-alanine ligase
VEIIREPAAMTAWSAGQSAGGHTIGLVPTMGFFHEGHLGLMRTAGRRADRVVVSLFVNPTQFGPNEDLDAYPRDFERDCSLARGVGVDVLFAPQAEAMYPQGSRTTVKVTGLTDHLCGAARPGHFDGVATVVTKLFNIVRPDLAVFGQKDFQQLAVIRRMTTDLNMGVEIIGHPIVREPDGLAMSSRNTYLRDDQRRAALSLSRSLALARELAGRGERETAKLAQAVRGLILDRPGTEIDYVSFVDDRTLQPVDRVDDHTVLALAVKIGGRVRLIDNGYLLADTVENSAVEAG